MAKSLNTPYATLAFAHLFSPRPRSEGTEPVYSCTLLFDPDAQKTPAYKAMKVACIEAAKEKFGEKVDIKRLRMPFRDAAEKEGQYEGYIAGHIFINPWTKDKPGVVDNNRNDILLREQVFAGQLVRGNVTPFAYDQAGNKGVSFALNHVQIIKADMPRIDGRASARSAFDDGEVTEDDDDDDGDDPF